MKKALLFLLIWALLSCRQENKESLNKEIANSKPKNEISIEEAFDYNYKIFDFRKLNDSTKYFARIKHIPTFGDPFILEAEEIRTFNGLFLSFKVPIVEKQFTDTILSGPGLLYDQNCFWFDSTKSKEIKQLFTTYFSKNSTDTNCSTCLHKSIFKVELYDYGTYSEIFNNHVYLSSSDSTFVSKFNRLIKQKGEKMAMILND